MPFDAFSEKSLPSFIFLFGGSTKPKERSSSRSVDKAYHGNLSNKLWKNCGIVQNIPNITEIQEIKHCIFHNDFNRCLFGGLTP